MTKEDKELLLKDLCARLSYGVIVRVYSNNGDYDYSLTGIINSQHEYPEIEIDGRLEDEFCIQSCKPYLRLMSSMTKEEEKEYNKLRFMIDIDENIKVPADNYKSYDYLNSHHFDYRGLIPKSLAIEAPKNMYKI